MWDIRKQVETEFPTSEWIHISVSNPDEGRQAIGAIVMRTRRPLVGQARWFGPGDGVILIRKSDILEPPPKKQKPWWKFW